VIAGYTEVNRAVVAGVLVHKLDIPLANFDAFDGTRADGQVDGPEQLRGDATVSDV
jgi:hypothetical protein